MDLCVRAPPFSMAIRLHTKCPAVLLKREIVSSIDKCTQQKKIVIFSKQTILNMCVHFDWNSFRFIKTGNMKCACISSRIISNLAKKCTLLTFGIFSIGSDARNFSMGQPENLRCVEKFNSI